MYIYVASVPFQIGSTPCHPLLMFCVAAIPELLLVYSVSGRTINNVEQQAEFCYC